jgi:hypothetical protein
MIRRTGGKIFRAVVAPESEPGENGPTFNAELASDNPLVGLALQFGEALGMRKALRSAIGTTPNSRALEKLYEPHSRGSILVAAVFDAFFTVYVRRSKDLMRMASTGKVQISPDEMHPDLINRLAETATKTAETFLNICIRALDYCPPVDILFGDFLRAMITADYNLVPNDKYGYRAALIDAFRSRGIFPSSVISFSEESLLWDRPESNRDESIPRCTGLEFSILYVEDKEKIKKQQKNNHQILYNFAINNAEKLHLSKDPELKTWVSSIQEMHHVSDTGRLVLDFVIQIIQSRDVPIDKDDQNSPSFKFRGGITLILGQEGQVRYIIYKNIDKKTNGENNRLNRQRDYLLLLQNNLAIAPYNGMEVVDKQILEPDFNIIHRGY